MSGDDFPLEMPTQFSTQIRGIIENHQFFINLSSRPALVKTAAHHVRCGGRSLPRARNSLRKSTVPCELHVHDRGRLANKRRNQGFELDLHVAAVLRKRRRPLLRDGALLVNEVLSEKIVRPDLRLEGFFRLVDAMELVLERAPRLVGHRDCADVVGAGQSVDVLRLQFCSLLLWRQLLACLLLLGRLLLVLRFRRGDLLLRRGLPSL